MINPKTLEKIIYSFYDKAKKDILIGYHFRIIKDFDKHIPRIVQFWNLQLNGQITDRNLLPFKLIEVHKPLGIKIGEVNRWTTLFEQTLKEFKKDLTSEQTQEFLLKISHFKEILVDKLI